MCIVGPMQDVRANPSRDARTMGNGCPTLVPTRRHGSWDWIMETFLGHVARAVKHRATYSSSMSRLSRIVWKEKCGWRSRQPSCPTEDEDNQKRVTWCKKNDDVLRRKHQLHMDAVSRSGASRAIMQHAVDAGAVRCAIKCACTSAALSVSVCAAANAAAVASSPG